MKESQGRERSLGGGRSGHEAALYANGIGREGEADGGDAGGPARLGLVGDQTVERVRLVDEIVERLTLQGVHKLRTDQLRAGHGGEWVADRCKPISQTGDGFELRPSKLASADD